MKNDYEIVLAAVSQNGKALFYTTDVFRSKQEIMLNAAKSNGEIALYLANSVYKHDESFLLTCLQSNAKSINYVPSKFLNDRNFIARAIRVCPKLFTKIPNDYIQDDAFLQVALDDNPYIILYLTRERQLKYLDKAIEKNPHFRLLKPYFQYYPQNYLMNKKYLKGFQKSIDHVEKKSLFSNKSTLLY